MLKNLSRLSILLLFCFCAFSCTSKDSVLSIPQETGEGGVAGVQAHDFAPGQLEAHYQKHGGQFGAITIDQYLDQARRLLDAPAGNDVAKKIRPNGDILHYRISTGEFAVMTPRGRIRTYFKTDMRYWMKQ
ncbi:MAG: hypothetical protein HQL14_05800 [Candidatus Omnitrophica bacterium]|nr:hypothetical protein [Candidatus Omnitrophota bacterium]